MHDASQSSPSLLPGMKRKRHIPRVLLLVEVSRIFGRRVIEGVSQYAREHGPWSIFFEDWGLDVVSTAPFMEWRFDGVISRAMNAKVAKFIRAAQLPRVELLGMSPKDPVDVKMDIGLAAKMAVEHFLNHGYRHFAFCTVAFNWWTVEHDKRFREAVEEKGYQSHTYSTCATNKSVFFWNRFHEKEVAKWLRRLPRPIGIYAGADNIAVHLLDLCGRMKISVPDEIAILGIGNDPLLCESTRPTLSSLDIDAHRIGYEAAKLLHKRMAGRTGPSTTILVPPSHIVTRQSTDHLAVEDPDIQQAMLWIQASACTGLTVEYLAQKIGMSQKVLERRFRYYFGTTPKKELIQVRIDKAKMLLAQTEETIDSIVRKCGFNSRAYFMQAFCRNVGMTPGAYRQEQRLFRKKQVGNG